MSASSDCVDDPAASSLEAEVQRCRSAVAARYLRGTGIEVGAGSRPVPLPPGATVRYGDVRDGAALAAYFGKEIERQGFIDAQTLAGIPDSSQDFVISAHVIEHLHDPLGAIANAIRVLRPGGHHLLIVPDMRHTFDRDRPETTIEHMLADHRDGGRGSVEQAYREHLLHVHPLITGERIAPEDLPKNLWHGMEFKIDIHMHAWTGRGFRQFLDAARRFLPFRVLHQDCVVNENIFVLRKRSGRPWEKAWWAA